MIEGSSSTNNFSNNCFLNTMATMLFNCEWFKWFAKGVVGTEGHKIEITNKRRQVCYTCQVAVEYINRTPISNVPANNTWTTEQFLAGLDDEHTLGAFGDTAWLLELFMVALIEDTEKYHRHLSPNFNFVLQSTISKKLPTQIHPPGPRNTEFPLPDRINHYFKEIGRVPKMFLVRFRDHQGPLRIRFNHLQFDLKSVAQYCHQQRHYKSVVLINNIFWLVDCFPSSITHMREFVESENSQYTIGL